MACQNPSLGRAVATFKETLAVKSLKSAYPSILWIQPPSHDGFVNNSERYKFNKCLQEAVKFHEDVYTLELKKSWEPNNGNLYLAVCQHFTCDGYCTYWEAVDKTIRYFDSIMLKKEKSKSMSKSFQKGDLNDHFRWQNPRFKPVGLFTNRLSKKLPTPLPRKN